MGCGAGRARIIAIERGMQRGPLRMCSPLAGRRPRLRVPLSLGCNGSLKVPRARPGSMIALAVCAATPLLADHPDTGGWDFGSTSRGRIGLTSGVPADRFLSGCLGVIRMRLLWFFMFFGNCGFKFFSEFLNDEVKLLF